MSEGQVVGTISIKVTPDTSKFRRELRDELDAIERGEEAKVEVKADFDKDGLGEKVDAAAKEAEARTKIKVHTEVDGVKLRPEAVNRALSDIQTRLGNKNNAKHSIRLDPELGTGFVDDLRKRLGYVELSPEIVSGRFLNQAKLRQLEASINLKPHLDEVAIEEMRLRLAHENFTAKVKLETDSAKLERLASKGVSDFDKSLDKIFGERPTDWGTHPFSGLFKRGAGGGVPGGGGHSGMGGVSELFNFGSPINLLAIASLLPAALAIVAPALTAIPALIAGVAAPVGVLALGLDGLKKAAENAGLAVAGKKGKLSVGGALKSLQDAASDVFAKGFTPILTQLLTVAGPATTAVRGVAEAIVDIAGGVTNTLTSPALVNQMSTLFANIGGAISASTPGLSAFTTGLVNLATQVSTHFPGLANWFNQMGEKFSGWVSKITASGALDKATSSLRPVLDDVVGFIGKLFDAGIKFAGDPKMASSIHEVLGDLSGLITGALPGLADTFEKIAEGLRDIRDAGGWLSKFIGGDPKTGSPPLIQKVPPGQGAPTPSGSGTPWWDVITRSQQWGTDAHDWLSKIFSGQTQQQQQGLPGDGNTWFGHTKTALGNAFTGNSEWEHTLGRNVGGPVGRFFTGDNQWEQSLANGAKGVSSQITAALQALPGQVSGIFNQVADAGKSAWSRLVSAAQQAISQVVSAFQALPGQILSILSGLGAQLYSAGASAMSRLADGVRSAAGSVLGAVSGALGGVLNLIPHSPAPDGPFSAQGWNQLYTGGQAIGNQFQTGLEDGFQGVVKSATDLVGQVQSALSQGGLMPEGLRGNVQSELKAIGTEYDQLKVQRDALDPKDKSGRQGLTAQLQQLQNLRDKLKLGDDQLPQGAHGKQNQSIQQNLGQTLSKLPSIGAGFATANINQFEQDLGMSGQGAIPSILNQGIGWATQLLGNSISSVFGGKGNGGGHSPVTFNVGNMDEALTGWTNMRNKQALGVMGR